MKNDSISAELAKRKLHALSAPEVAASTARFFRTGPGRYGEGDVFIGVRVPAMRVLARELRGLPLQETGLLLSSAIHEERHIVSTQHFIRHGDLTDTFLLGRRLLHDAEDLIHKATGWMLREAGIRDESLLLAFLDQHAPEMPRTMLRYAMERLPAELRRRYL
ncbi:MAG: DNA alkylation repair protein [Planctomycetaceae bacterium]